MIQTAVIQLYKDTLRPPLERHSRIEKNPTTTEIVLLWLLLKTVVNVSYCIVGHVPRTISVPCGLFLKKGGTISCVVTGPRQPRYSHSKKCGVHSTPKLVCQTRPNWHTIYGVLCTPFLWCA